MRNKIVSSYTTLLLFTNISATLTSQEASHYAQLSSHDGGNSLRLFRRNQWSCPYISETENNFCYDVPLQLLQPHRLILICLSYFVAELLFLVCALNSITEL